MLPIGYVRSLMVHGRALDTYSWTRLYERTKKLTRLFVGGGVQNEAFGACLPRQHAVEKEDEDVAQDYVFPRLRTLVIADYRFVEHDSPGARR